MIHTIHALNAGVRSRLAPLLLTLLFGAGPLTAQQMNYQGRLTDANGNAVADGQYTLRFNIYTNATIGTLKWGTQTNVVDVVQGRFNAILGPTALTGGTLDNAFGGASPRFLQITVGNNAPILPRQQILHAPEAFHALKADFATVAAAVGSGGSSVLTLSGNLVGINNPIPTSALDVAGNIRATGTITGNGAGLTALNGANINNASIDVSKLVAAVQQALCPPGTIMAYAGDAAPPGWAICDGTFGVDPASQPALFAVIGYRFGGFTSSGVHYFVLPDLRGRFLRGRDRGAGRDPDTSARSAMYLEGATGDAVGSVQSHAFQDHTHTYTKPQICCQADDSGSAYREVSPSEVSGTTGVASGQTSTETRPVNAYVNYIIKY